MPAAQVRRLRKGMVIIVNKLAAFLYKRARERRLPLFSARQVDEDLAQLYRGEKAERAKTDYYVKKIAMCLMILLAGLIFGLAARVNAKRTSMLEEGDIIYRGSYEDGERQVRLMADDGESRRRFFIQVAPKTLTKAEVEEYFERFFRNAEEYLLGRNEDFQHVCSDLTLEEAYEGFPFKLDWESSRPEVIDSQGRVREVGEAVAADLKVTLTCQDMVRSEVIEIMVVPPYISPEESARREMEAYLLKTEEESRGEEAWSLPGDWEGRMLAWSFEREDHSLLIWAATPLVAVLVYMLSDRDLHEKLKKRQKKLQQEYPDIVHRIVLYVGAGMTIRGALQKIGGDYEKKVQGNNGRRPGCEEVLYTCRELQAGVSELTAYEHFGRRTGLREYIRLSTLLGQKLKRGNNTLLTRLREEAEKSSEETLLQVRKLGEEAGTKLLTPMVMMLAVVMIMIMVPAFGIM